MTSVSRWGGMARPCSGRVLNLLVTSIGGSPIYQQDMRASTGTPGFLVKVSYNTREECVGGNSQGVFFRVHSLAFAPRGCALWNWLHFSNLQKVSGQHLPLHLLHSARLGRPGFEGPGTWFWDGFVDWLHWSWSCGCLLKIK